MLSCSPGLFWICYRCSDVQHLGVHTLSTLVAVQFHALLLRALWCWITNPLPLYELSSLSRIKTNTSLTFSAKYQFPREDSYAASWKTLDCNSTDSWYNACFTDITAFFLKGMWPGYLRTGNFGVQPNFIDYCKPSPHPPHRKHMLGLDNSYMIARGKCSSLGWYFMPKEWN